MNSDNNVKEIARNVTETRARVAVVQDDDYDVEATAAYFASVDTRMNAATTPAALPSTSIVSRNWASSSRMPDAMLARTSPPFPSNAKNIRETCETAQQPPNRLVHQPHATTPSVDGYYCRQALYTGTYPARSFLCQSGVQRQCLW